MTTPTKQPPKCDDCDQPARCCMVLRPGQPNEGYLYACDEHCKHPWCDLTEAGCAAHRATSAGKDPQP